ncbi:unnamed protein product [Cuscuta epithymum]|uniref:CASP-like protein n=1 Tax=Cuscuta epithymum TaxID=186058 RepID=A0AAV0FUA1_9ASTE|nr:unnamed protein product [Cuscuta epithymum]
MDGVSAVAAMGTPASLVSRLVVTVCSIASLLIICYSSQSDDSYESYSFWLLVSVMALLIPWSLATAVADCYVIFVLRNQTRHPGLTRAVIATDWMFAFFSFAASSATASTADFLFPACGITACHHYQIAAAAGFLCYVLLYGCSLFNLWILPWL